jgi:2,4-dienoyl-CoA reductase-like NADH-dependent reductase (Old Yellow Enzyme family)/NADPH-dependent 2,4-dienoyl-CoA reductase/sulfur reductase-like enzyme
MAQSALAALLAPGRIGPLELRNRMVVTAMGMSFAEADGTCSDRLIAYHEEQARGGVGLIIMGATSIAWPVGGVQQNQVAISDDRHIPGLKRLADSVHRHGGKIGAQLHQGGLNAGYAAMDGHPLWAPSIPHPPSGGDFHLAYLPEERPGIVMDGPMPIKVLDEDDIQLLIRQFAQAAVRARAAGLDGVEVHAGHGYILSSFLSPATNRRTDGYGGSLENRARLTLEVVRAVRAAVGPDFAVWCKLDSREVGKPDGITLEDARQTAKMVEAAGADGITVTAYHDMAYGKLQTESYFPHTPELNLPYAAAIKAELNIPVIASGRVEPASASARIAAGQFDFLAMGRLMLADPHLPNKLAEGRVADIRPCIYCYTCISCNYMGLSPRCAVNPEMGREYLRASERAIPSSRRIVVIGGGPAGMEAARRLDAEGHAVTLVEKDGQLGGTLRFASVAYEPNERLLDWLRGQLAKSRVEVRLNTEATAELLRALRPDEVIVATGAVRETPPIPGADLPHVFGGDELRQMMLGESSDALRRKVGVATRIAAKVGAATGLTANLDFVRKATRQWMPLGDRIVIIGGELVGLELAEFLVERGRSVAVVEESANFGRGLSIARRARLVPELREHGVGLHALAKDVQITADGVRFAKGEGQWREIVADNVIVAKGARGDSRLADALRAAGFKVREIGDGTGVGYIDGAINSAAAAAAAI